MILRLTFICLACLTLLACTSQRTGKQPAELVLEVFGGGADDVTPRFATLLRAEPPSPALQVAIIDEQVNTTLLLESRSGNFETWLSSDGASLTFERGMLHSTRGTNTGLLASELSEPLALVLSGRQGTSDRFMTYLDGDDFAVTRTFRCTVEIEGSRTLTQGNQTISTRLMSEDCRSLGQSFRNLYWVATGSGRIVQSRQWASDVTGYISTRVVLK
ncbi:YjbF family lipoprotein [Tateyamaria pelophila]|uniref:YjbF family lipoprotein n=1 Tax=Tateyamaria pelophila TaxID=328415 RepID=UPI001CBBCEA7|nr:YjbF family lipoprotein [Tateyamaria pelophila]